MRTTSRAKMRFLMAALLALLPVAPVNAADCTNPSGPEGTQMYNTDHHTFQFCNGTNWIGWGGGGGGGGGGMTLISTQTASNSASLQWTGLGSSYPYYKLLCTDIVLSDLNTSFDLQFGEGATPTWETSNYGNYGRWIGPAGNGTFGGSSDPGMPIGGSQGNAFGNYSIFTEGMISNLASSIYKQAHFTSEYLGGASWIGTLLSGVYTGDTGIVTAMRVMPRAGNIVSGQCSLYGMK